MLGEREQAEIARLWERKLRQDEQGLPQAEGHRNLEPASAEFLSSLAAGIGAKRILEIGGSTIALATAARRVSGTVTSIEIEPRRQSEARQTLARLELDAYVEFVLADAERVLATLSEFDLVFIDCEKEDYVRLFDMVHVRPGGFVVADNVTSHNLVRYIAHVRSQPRVESMTLPIGKGPELTRLRAGGR
jgi:predicted O-methyltransferase YrrM